MSKKTDYGPAAEKLYIEAGKSIDDLAALLPVSRKSIGDWCREGKWVAKRRQRATGPSVVAAKIEAAIAEILNRDVIDASAADAIHKLNKTLQAYLKDSESHFLTKAIEVMDRFLDRLMTKYKTPEDRRIFTDEIDEFFSALEDAHQ